MLEEKKKYLRFTEANAWKGETWTVYTPLDDPSDLNLVEKLLSYTYPGQYEMKIVSAHPDQLKQLEAFSDSYDADDLDEDGDEDSNYYPSVQVLPMTPSLEQKLQELADFMESTGQNWNKADDEYKALQGIDERLYKLGVFMS